VLVVDGLSKRYGTVDALDDVSFGVERGQVVGFLGPNGAGKTTAMRAIMRLINVDRGVVTWDGGPVTAVTRQRFGYMPAERGMYQRMKVREHLAYYARLSGLGDRTDAVCDEWLDRLSLSERGDDLVQNLSSGNQQRVQLALALLNDPELLVLDEPFSGLDPIAADLLGDILREQVAGGAALLLSSHQLDLVADVCEAVVIVDQGRVVLRGDVAEIRATSPTRYIDVEFATPTSWVVGGAVMVGDDGRRHRVSVDVETNADALIADAKQLGDVVSYSFAPPDLSEVFMGAVGRDTVEAPTSDAGNPGAQLPHGDNRER
jgi:ABC-2 type transport system ATP-binding protein